MYGLKLYYHTRSALATVAISIGSDRAVQAVWHHYNRLQHTLNQCWTSLLHSISSSLCTRRSRVAFYSISHISLYEWELITMCWLKLAATAVSLCWQHCWLQTHLVVVLWLSGSQVSPLITVGACAALQFWFNTRMPTIFHPNSSPFIFYLYHSISPPYFPFFILILTRAGPVVQLLNQIYCQVLT